MKPFVLIFALLLNVISLGPAMAGNEQIWRYNRHSAEPPFPLSKRAESIWASSACWDECGSYTAWHLVACLEHDAQGRCLKRADHGDRACQRDCRSGGGPFVPDIFDF